mmetsp:Transcript_25409/g.65668  ORF Transcript_25409/g.65668 Transcript_25409/m.65668 type:complete len:233 (-) Transcript_25409:314-1012(-)
MQRCAPVVPDRPHQAPPSAGALSRRTAREAPTHHRGGRGPRRPARAPLRRTRPSARCRGQLHMLLRARSGTRHQWARGSKSMYACQARTRRETSRPTCRRHQRQRGSPPRLLLRASRAMAASRRSWAARRERASRGPTAAQQRCIGTCAPAAHCRRRRRRGGSWGRAASVRRAASTLARRRLRAARATTRPGERSHHCLQAVDPTHRTAGARARRALGQRPSTDAGPGGWNR